MRDAEFVNQIASGNVQKFKIENSLSFISLVTNITETCTWSKNIEDSDIALESNSFLWPDKYLDI